MRHKGKSHTVDTCYGALQKERMNRIGRFHLRSVQTAEPEEMMGARLQLTAITCACWLILITFMFCLIFLIGKKIYVIM